MMIKNEARIFSIETRNETWGNWKHMAWNMIDKMDLSLDTHSSEYTWIYIAIRQVKIMTTTL